MCERYADFYTYSLCRYGEIMKELEEYRLENRISQEQLAEMLGVHFSTVNRWLNGHQKPNKIQTYHIKKLLKGNNK